MTLTSSTELKNASASFSMPRVLLHLEGLALLVSAVALYAYQGYSWWVFVVFLLAPDLFAAGYLIGPRLGAYLYNSVHTVVLPLGLAILSLVLQSEIGLQVALIWLAHIGMDRAVGYGLKYTSAFKETHMGRV